MKRSTIVKMTAKTLALTRSNKAARPRVQDKHARRLTELQKQRHSAHNKST